MSQNSPVCPKCGRQSRQLHEALSAQLELIRQAQSQPPPSPDPEEPQTSSGSGTHASGDQLLVGALTQLMLELGGAALDAAVVKPASEWWKTTGQAKVRERRERMMQALTDGLDRHPELYVCATDNLVFVPGSSRTVPVNEAARLLFKRDDARLMSLLSS